MVSTSVCEVHTHSTVFCVDLLASCTLLLSLFFAIKLLFSRMQMNGQKSDIFCYVAHVLKEFSTGTGDVLFHS